ncbi:hypothetical protein [Lactobacillus sp. HT06-2]|nr:hypothetical protein [Lactobacillus sp. HT06-2]
MTRKEVRTLVSALIENLLNAQPNYLEDLEEINHKVEKMIGEMKQHVK